MAGHVAKEIQLGRQVAFLTKEVKRLEEQIKASYPELEELKRLRKENAELKEKLVRFTGQC